LCDRRRSLSGWSRGLDGKKPLAVLDRLSVLDVSVDDLALVSDVISFISFIASMMQSTWSFWTRSPTSTNEAAPGSGQR
jgi:hypothetical protein